MKRVGSVLSRSELDPFLYIWYHTVRTQSGLSPCGLTRNLRNFCEKDHLSLEICITGLDSLITCLYSCITDLGFKVSPQKAPASPSSERSLVFSVSTPTAQSSPSSGRLTPTNLGSGSISYNSPSINLSPYSSQGSYDWVK